MSLKLTKFKFLMKDMNPLPNLEMVPDFSGVFCDAFPKGLRRFLDMLELQPIWNISHKQILYYSFENALSYNTKVK